MVISYCLFSPRKSSSIIHSFSFLPLIHTSIQPKILTIDDDTTISTSVLDSLHKGLNWKTLTQKFVSVRFTNPIVQTILLQLKEPINSRKALNFFHWSAKEMHLQHGIFNYCITIHILVKSRLTKDAKALLESILTNNDFFDGTNDKVFVVLNSLIESYVVVDSVPYVFDLFVQVCAKLRMVNGVLDACKFLFDNGFVLSVYSLNTLLHVMQKSDVPHLVWGVYEHMIGARIYPNEMSLRIMVSAFCKEGKLEKFVDIVDRMHGKRCSVPRIIVNTCLVYQMIEENRIEDGLVLLKRMLQKNMILDTVSYSLVVLAKLKIGNLNAAQEVYDEMLNRGFEQNSFVCSLFVGKYSEEGRIDEAIELLEEMENSGFTLLNESFNKLIEGCSANGQLENSLKFCEKMIKIGVLPTCSTTNKMFEKLCENKKSKQADDLLTTMLDKGFVPDENMYSHLIAGYCKEGDIEAAIKLLFEMEYRSISPNKLGFSSLIVMFCKHGRLSEAEKYLEMMKARSFIPSSIVYECLITGHFNKGDKTRAHQLHCEMVGMT